MGSETCFSCVANAHGDIMGKRKSVVEEAQEVVSGARAHSYGKPIDNHGCTADLWQSYLARKYDGVDFTLTAEDVCMMNILQKISRHANRPKRDNLVDIVGYTMNIELVQEAMEDLCEKKGCCDAAI